MAPRVSPTLAAVVAASLLLTVSGDAKPKPARHSDSHEYRYHPHKGYEPYWEEGGWMAEDPAKRLPPNTTTQKIPTVCDEECTYIYRDLGNVCAHLSADRTVLGCDPNDIGYFNQFWNFASAVFGSTVYPCAHYREPDVLTGYYTFGSYCEFLDKRCRQNRTIRWIFVHLGSCRDQWTYYMRPRFPGEIANRTRDYLGPLKEKYPNLFKKKDK